MWLVFHRFISMNVCIYCLFTIGWKLKSVITSVKIYKITEVITDKSKFTYDTENNKNTKTKCIKPFSRTDKAWDSYHDSKSCFWLKSWYREVATQFATYMQALQLHLGPKQLLICVFNSPYDIFLLVTCSKCM